MPLPAEIQALLDNAPTGFDPSKTRKEYEDYKPIWRMYLDLYELDQAKLSAMVEKHSATEDPGKYELRKKLAAAYNLVPTIINMCRNYLFSDTPTISSTDPELQAFIDDCDGNGLPLADWVKTQALPLSQVMGFVDALVEHPNTLGEEIVTRADVAAANLRPHVVAFTPLDRINWSSSPDGGYNWARYIDVGDEGLNPFVAPAAGSAYVTMAYREDGNAFWVRSTKDAVGAANFEHDGGDCPTKRVPIATLFFQRSIDRQKRRHGTSKLAMIAVLTKQIIQILSWTTEDVLANLAILALPTQGGKEAKKEDGSPAINNLGAFSIINFPKDAVKAPFVLQGGVDHIAFKLTLIELHLREIMRVANLMVAAGDAKTTKSGVQGVVERNELFRELKDTASSLDSFTLEVLALAQSWIKDKDISAADLDGTVSVHFYDGPFTIEPIADLLANCEKFMDVMRGLSPTACEAVVKQVARAVITSDNDALQQSLKELKGSGEKLQELPPVVVTPPDPNAQPAGESDLTAE